MLAQPLRGRAPCPSGPFPMPLSAGRTAAAARASASRASRMANVSSRLCTVERSAETSSCVASPKRPAAKRVARSSSALIAPPTPTAFMAAFMRRGSPITRETRGSLITRIALPTNTSFTASNMAIARLCHATCLASTQAARHAGRVQAASFLFGWLGGLAVVLRLWEVADAPRWMLWSGTGYVMLMLVPVVVGFGFARLIGRLAMRGWGGGSLSLLTAGAAGLVAGLFAL